MEKVGGKVDCFTGEISGIENCAWCWNSGEEPWRERGGKLGSYIFTGKTPVAPLVRFARLFQR